MTHSNLRSQIPWVSKFQAAVNVLGGQGPAGRAIGASQQRIYFILNAAKKFPTDLLTAVEMATNGVISRSDLRPDLFPHDVHSQNNLTSETVGHLEKAQKIPSVQHFVRQGDESCGR